LHGGKLSYLFKGKCLLQPKSDFFLTIFKPLEHSETNPFDVKQAYNFPFSSFCKAVLDSNNQICSRFEPDFSRFASQLPRQYMD
jgi:hypothetical protein